MSPEGNGSLALIGHVICCTISWWDIIFPCRATETAFYECNFKVMSLSCTLEHLAAWVSEYHTTNQSLMMSAGQSSLQPQTATWHKLKAMTFLSGLIFVPLFPPETNLWYTWQTLHLKPFGLRGHITAASVQGSEKKCHYILYKTEQ